MPDYRKAIEEAVNQLIVEGQLISVADAPPAGEPAGGAPKRKRKNNTRRRRRKMQQASRRRNRGK